jgi:glycosyltransferase involved in cell wall biosynthesis
MDLAPRIIAILLVRNEDIFVEQAVRNVLDFCDEVFLADNGSRDETFSILQRLVDDHPTKLHLHRIGNPSESHDLIKNLAGQDVWVFGVDGDELFDPVGLARLRRRLLNGELADVWLVRGNVLHCLELDADRRRARGYLSPPAPSMTKLHNFSLIESWDGGGRNPERLHGREGLRFKPGAFENKLELNKIEAWDEASLRCLHVCFLRRSSGDRGQLARRNIPDQNAPRPAPRRAWTRVRELARIPEQSSWKNHYRVGPVEVVSAEPFFDVTRAS